MNDSVTASHLARWLEPAGIELGPERLAALAGVVAALGDGLAGHELDAVDAAYGRLDDRARAWAASVLGDKAPTVNPQEATALLERLLAAAVVDHLDNSDIGIRCALAVGSAQFLGLMPLIEELPVRAAEALASSGRSARQRTGIAEAAASSALGSLPKARKRTEETSEEFSVDDVADDVGAHAQSLRSLVKALDAALNALAGRQAALDEEVEMLWWALRASDDKGTNFSELGPATRAVSAAGELADRTNALPGPPSAGFLLARVLGDGGSGDITLAELAGAVSERLRPPRVSPHRLLPLSSAAAELARQGTVTGDEAWRTVVKRTLDVTLESNTTLAAGAQQVYCELLLERLLPADE